MLRLRSAQSILPLSFEPTLFLTLQNQEVTSRLLRRGVSSLRCSIFDQLNSALSVTKTRNSQRTNQHIEHIKKSSKTSVQKIGALFLNSLRAQTNLTTNNGQNDFVSTKQKIKESSSRVFKSKHRITHSQNSQIRVTQLEEQLRELRSRKKNCKIEKKRDSLQTRQKDHKELDSPQFVLLSKSQQNSTQQLSKRIFQGLLQKDQEAFKQNDKFGFYANMKKKFRRQIQKIETDNMGKNQKILTNGCLMSIDQQTQDIRKYLTGRTRPQTSITRTGLKDKSRKPKQSKFRTIERKQFEYMMVDSNPDSVQSANPKDRPKTSVGKKQNIHHYQSVINKTTFRHISPANMSQISEITKKEIQNQKLKEKMLVLLVECDKQAKNFPELNAGLQVFESYTNTINKGLLDVTKLLKNGDKKIDQNPLSKQK